MTEVMILDLRISPLLSYAVNAHDAEARLQRHYAEGWRLISLLPMGGGMSAIMEREGEAMSGACRPAGG